MSGPLLLVSVRNPEEARAAYDGGAAFIDLKEPSHGPMGMVDASIVESVITTLQLHSGWMPRTIEDVGRYRANEKLPTAIRMSMALGELTDWLDRPVIEVPMATSWLKLGLSGCASRPAWHQDWINVRRNFREHNGYRDLIPVAYADHLQANSPPVMDVLQAAANLECGSVLIDTFDKSDGSLLSILGDDQLLSASTKARQLGLGLALAGRLSITDFERLRVFEPDIIGVRSAACVDQNRSGRVDVDRVRALAQRLSG